MITITPVLVFDDNYVWVLHAEGASAAAVVDPGDADPVHRYLASHDLELEAVLVTHHHRDHVGGVESLAAEAGCPVYGPAAEDVGGLTRRLSEGDVIAAGGLELAVLDVPGHTRGHIAYHASGLVLCGDTLFAGGCGRLFEGTAETMYSSLMKLASLPPTTQVYCAHEYTAANLLFALAVEPDNTALRGRLDSAERELAAGRPTLPSRLDLELATNPFLRCEHPEVVASARRHAGRRLEPGVEVFAEIRRWKDGFRG